jgi:steroid delta-isomerase-like uncharacterized protein
MEIARRYHETWNGRDADALVASFTENGFFCNPDTYPGINGEALASHVKTVWTALPDLHLEIINAGEIEPNLVAHHWLLTGTNTGPTIDGSAPTGRALSFKGVSLVQVEGDKIASDQCYFDRKMVDSRLAPS